MILSLLQKYYKNSEVKSIPKKVTFFASYSILEKAWNVWEIQNLHSIVHLLNMYLCKFPFEHGIFAMQMKSEYSFLKKTDLCGWMNGKKS